MALVVSVTSGLLLVALLVVSMRSRLREIAILRTLGLGGRGVRWSLAAQATVTTVVPLLVAIPIGVTAGSWAWSSYARDLGVVGTPVTPWLLIGLPSLLAIVVANIVASVTAPSLARRPI